MNILPLVRLLSLTTLLVIFCPTSFAQSPSIGSKAPEFSLKDMNGKDVSLSKYSGKIVVLEWFNPECPFVKKHYNPGSMQNAQKKVVERGGVWLTISSSAEGKQGFLTTESAKSLAASLKLNSTAVLLDHSGMVGRTYGARTTPHMFVIGKDGTLAYAGAVDDHPSVKESDIPGAKSYVLAAFDALAAGESVGTAVTEPYGCSVKYGSR
jgi:peroxiredoxin